MASVLAIDADVLKLAGSGANATAAGATYTQVYLLQAEGMVCLETRYDWVTNVGSISAIGKEALRIAVASLAAISVIKDSRDLKDTCFAGTSFTGTGLPASPHP